MLPATTSTPTASGLHASSSVESFAMISDGCVSLSESESASESASEGEMVARPDARDVLVLSSTSPPAPLRSNRTTPTTSSSPVIVPRALPRVPSVTDSAPQLAAKDKAAAPSDGWIFPATSSRRASLEAPLAEQSTFFIPNQLSRQREQHFLAPPRPSESFVQVEMASTVTSAISPPVALDASQEPFKPVSLVSTSNLFTDETSIDPSVSLLVPSPPSALRSVEDEPPLVVSPSPRPITNLPKASRYARLKTDVPLQLAAFDPDRMLASLGIGLLPASAAENGGSDYSDIEMSRKSSNNSAASNATSSSSSASLIAPFMSLTKSSSLPMPAGISFLHEPERCFCCRLGWRSRIIGFTVTGCMSLVLFLLSFISLGRMFLATPLAFTSFYVAAHIAFMISTCFLVGPWKSYVSLFSHTRTRRFLAGLYLGLLAMLVGIGFGAPGLGWFGLVPIYCLHLAAFSYYCLMHLPLSRAVWARAFARAYKSAPSQLPTTTTKPIGGFVLDERDACCTNANDHVIHIMD